METFLDKKLLKLSDGKPVQRILRGFGPFMSLRIDEYMEMAASEQQNNIEMVMTR